MISDDEYIAGVDEAGCGPLAGPVVIAAVILDPIRTIDGLNDSKLLSENCRQRLNTEIRKHARCFSVITIGVNEIERRNILGATLFGMRRALSTLTIRPKQALIDGNRLPKRLPCPARAIVHGDALEPVISAASILAKVARDALMLELDRKYPGYGFAQHKGYSTPEHLAALNRLGPSPVHRRGYAPVRRFFEQPQLFASD